MDMTQPRKILVSTDLAPEEEWTKSSYSSQENGNCVEAAKRRLFVGVRDSKDKGPFLTFTSEEWEGFLGMVNSGDADFGVVDI